jgi:hypothetical protein
MAGAYDDLKIFFLLNSDKEETARTRIIMKIIIFVLKNSKSYQYIYFYLKYFEYLFFRIFFDQIKWKPIFKYCRV